MDEFLVFSNPDGNGNVEQFENSYLFHSSCNDRNCHPYRVEISAGIYLFEAWGSMGGSSEINLESGHGGFVSGNIKFSDKTTIYIYIGNRQGFNGGGLGGNSANSGSNGGGATDIRTDLSLTSRILVSGGGGGSGAHGLYNNIVLNANGNYGCHANITCINTKTDSCAGQAGSVGTHYNAGIGGAGGTYDFPGSPYAHFYQAGGGGGGGGYFGGGGGGSGALSGGSISVAGNRGSNGQKNEGGSGGFGSYMTEQRAYYACGGGAGAGGSNFIDSLRFTNITNKNGNDIFLSPSGEFETGHISDGTVRITKISKFDINTIDRIYILDILFYDLLLSFLKYK